MCKSYSNKTSTKIAKRICATIDGLQTLNINSTDWNVICAIQNTKTNYIRNYRTYSNSKTKNKVAQ